MLADYFGMSQEMVLNGMWISIFSLIGFEAIRQIYIHFINRKEVESE